MTYRCGYNGHAAATRTTTLNAPPVVEWTEADEKVHIAAELVNEPRAMYVIGEKYIVGAWCDEVQAFHATLIEETS